MWERKSTVVRREPHPFRRAMLATDELGRQLFLRCLPFVGRIIFALVDDTLCRKRAPS